MASPAADACEAVAEESASQVALKLGANEARQFTAGITLCGFNKQRCQVFADDAVAQSLFRRTTLVATPSRDRATDSQRLLG